MKFIALLLFSVMFVFVSTVQSQSLSQQKQRLAEGYESNGDFQNAYRLYMELWESDNNSNSYFDGLQRNLLKMGKYSELLEIAVKQNKNKPSSSLLILLGELSWRTGNNIAASNYWDQAIKMMPDQENLYINLANTLNNLQLFDKAAATLEQGRKTLNNADLFIDELSRLYIAIGDIKRGLPEVIKYLDKTKNLPSTQGRLYALMGNETKNKTIRDYLKTITDANNKNLFYQELYAWFLKTTGELQYALEVYIRLDELKNSKGWEVLNFANTCKEDGEYDIAFKAFEIIVDQGKSNTFLNQALYGYAQTLEAKYSTGSKIEKSKVEEIIKRYRNIISENPKTQMAAEAYYRIGQLYFSQNDFTNAKIAFEEISTNFAKLPIAADALNIIGEIAFNEDDIVKSTEIFQKVIKVYGANNQNATDIATLKLSDIEYYNGKFDSAQVLYTNLSQNANSNIANDALDRLLILSKLSQIPENVAKAFVSAEKLQERNLDSIAIIEFIACSEQRGADDIADLALYNAANLYYKGAKYNKAIEIYEKIINVYSKSIYRDVSRFKIGESYEMLNDKTKAIENFTKILVEFPQSILLQDARDKIRFLRGEI